MITATTEHPLAELTDSELEEMRLQVLAAMRDSEPGIVFRRLSDIQPEPVRFLWPDRIAMGKLSLVVGDPGLGKSLLTLDLAARVTTGRAWPDGAPNGSTGTVILLNAEDDAADTIRPRLDAAGADVSRVHVLDAVRIRDGEGHTSLRSFSLAVDLASLAERMDSIGDCRLIVIDPISAYLDGIDSHINTEVRGLLGPVASLAARAGVSVIAVSHLNKGVGSAVYRTSGSIAFVAAARAVWAVGKDSGDETGQRRLFLPVKNNLGPDTGGLAYTITSGAVPVMAWGEAVRADASDVLSGDGADPGERVEAATFLEDFLHDGPRGAQDVLRAARAAGIAERTLKRAKHGLGVHSTKGQSGWSWSLPVQGCQEGQEYHPGNVGILGTLDGQEATV
jgi:putative DNA primase/helicase